ncbi:MAG TPA: serine hydrolase domain-containing protein, partial [Vicinamibacteria bacterium]|nr:serine hydrolase domain-containing protein [Vicinamibacteria bacterium]
MRQGCPLASVGLALGLAACGADDREGDPAAAPVAWPQDVPFASALDTVVPERLRRARIPGAVVVTVANGAPEPARAYGEAVRESHVPMAPDTVFQAASLSKSVAAWGVLRLVETGLLSLDEAVVHRLTRWRWPPSPFDDSGVTARRLLSHTAGFSVHGYPGLSPETALPSLEESLSGNNGGAGSVQLVQAPGSRFLYSGGGYTLLQLLVEEVARAAVVARERLLQARQRR